MAKQLIAYTALSSLFAIRMWDGEGEGGDGGGDDKPSGISAVVTDLNSVPEGLRGYYKENNGKHYLQALGDNGVVLEDVSGMRGALDHEKSEVARAKKQAETLQAQLDEINANKQKDIDEAKRKAMEDAKNSGDIEALEASWQTKMNELKTTGSERESKLEGMLRKATIDSTAKSIANAIAIQGSADVLLPHITSRLSLDIEGNEANIRVLGPDGKLSALSISELQEEFKTNPAFAPMLVGSKGSGGGAPEHKGGGAPNKSRSQMTPAEKADYIDKHGNDAFFKIPFK